MTNQIRTKLVVGSADVAIDWYVVALDAVLLERHEADGSVVYAELAALDTVLTIKDADELDPPTAHLILDVRVPDPDVVWDAMVDAGAESVFAIDDRFYGLRGGRLRDPFGIQWIVSGPPLDGSATDVPPGP